MKIKIRETGYVNNKLQAIENFIKRNNITDKAKELLVCFGYSST